MEDTWCKITPEKENPGNRLIHTRRKKNFERTPRTTHWTDWAQTWTTVSRRPSSVDLPSVCANGARTINTTEYEIWAKKIQHFTNISLHIDSSPTHPPTAPPILLYLVPQPSTGIQVCFLVCTRYRIGLHIKFHVHRVCLAFAVQKRSQIWENVCCCGVFVCSCKLFPSRPSVHAAGPQKKMPHTSSSPLACATGSTLPPSIVSLRGCCLARAIMDALGGESSFDVHAARLLPSPKNPAGRLRQSF